MKLGVTVSPPATALSSVTVKVIASPSLAEASSIVTAGVLLPCLWALMIVPVAVSVAVTCNDVPETVMLTVKVSSSSSSASSAVATVKVCVSPAVPAKVSPAVFAV